MPRLEVTGQEGWHQRTCDYAFNASKLRGSAVQPQDYSVAPGETMYSVIRTPCQRQAMRSTLNMRIRFCLTSMHEFTEDLYYYHVIVAHREQELL